MIILTDLTLKSPVIMYAGHTKRTDENQLARRSREYNPEGVRSRVRPKVKIGGWGK